jgi:hypothetical protein
MGGVIKRIPITANKTTINKEISLTIDITIKGTLITSEIVGKVSTENAGNKAYKLMLLLTGD